MPKKLLLLGGYGNAGSPIAHLLLQETNLHIIIAGRSLNKAKIFAQELNELSETSRVTAGYADAADRDSLAIIFEEVDMVMVAASSTQFAENVIRAAIAAQIDYYDVQLSAKKKLAFLRDHAAKIAENELCFITDGGFHPGVPAAMVKYANQHFDHMDSAIVSAAFQLDWSELHFSDATLLEFADEIADYDATIFTEGKWQKSSKYPKFEFGPWFGKKYGAPMMMEELRAVTDQIPSLRHTGFYIAGFNWFTDYAILPLLMIGTRLFGNKLNKPLGRLFGWSLKRFSKPPYGAVLQINASGVCDGQPSTFRMRLSHVDPYLLTAIPTVACLLQFLSQPHRPGVFFQANFVEPNQFFNDLQRLGIKIEEKSGSLETADLL